MGLMDNAEKKIIERLIRQKRKEFVKAADQINSIKEELRELKAKLADNEKEGESQCQTQKPSN